MIGMPTILSIRQRLDAGDSVAQVARDEGVSEPTVRKYRDMDDLSRPGHPSVPRSLSGNQHTRLGNRNACDQHQLAPKHALDAPPSAQANPTCNFWAVSQAESA